MHSLLKKSWIRACPELALIGLSGTGPRAEGSTSDEDEAELIGTFLSVANRLLGAPPK